MKNVKLQQKLNSRVMYLPSNTTSIYNMSLLLNINTKYYEVLTHSLSILLSISLLLYILKMSPILQHW